MSAYKYIKPVYKTALVRIRTEKFANYHKYYHEQDAQSDVLYQSIKKIIDSHAASHNEDKKFYSPVTQEGITFKTTDTCKCYNVNARPCLLKDICDFDAVVKLKIQPYSFNDAVGVSITLIEARAKSS
jgi:hypothetical protein